MKNRVLRSALAVILVIAMVLTMAACKTETVVDPTEAPAPATAKPATEAPKTEAPATEAPATEAPADVTDTTESKLAEYGITFPDAELTYGKAANFGMKVDGNNDYQEAYKFEYKIKYSAVDHAGKSMTSTNAKKIIANDELTNGKSFSTINDSVNAGAGIYSVTYTITVEHDKDASYGYYTPGEVDEEYTFTKTYEIAKAELKLETKDDAYQISKNMFFVNAPIANEKDETLAKFDYSTSVNVTSCDGTVAGAYPLAITITDEDDNVVAADEITLANYYVTVKEGTRYILTAEEVAKVNAMRTMASIDDQKQYTTEYSVETITYYNTLTDGQKVMAAVVDATPDTTNDATWTNRTDYVSTKAYYLVAEKAVKASEIEKAIYDMDRATIGTAVEDAIKAYMTAATDVKKAAALTALAELIINVDNTPNKYGSDMAFILGNLATGVIYKTAPTTLYDGEGDAIEADKYYAFDNIYTTDAHDVLAGIDFVLSDTTNTYAVVKDGKVTGEYKFLTFKVADDADTTDADYYVDFGYSADNEESTFELAKSDYLVNNKYDVYIYEYVAAYTDVLEEYADTIATQDLNQGDITALTDAIADLEEAYANLITSYQLDYKIGNDKISAAHSSMLVKAAKIVDRWDAYIALIEAHNFDSSYIDNASQKDLAATYTALYAVLGYDFTNSVLSTDLVMDAATTPGADSFYLYTASDVKYYAEPTDTATTFNYYEGNVQKTATSVTVADDITRYYNTTLSNAIFALNSHYTTPDLFVDGAIAAAENMVQVLLTVQSEVDSYKTDLVQYLVNKGSAAYDSICENSLVGIDMTSVTGSVSAKAVAYATIATTGLAKAENLKVDIYNYIDAVVASQLLNSDSSFNKDLKKEGLDVAIAEMFEDLCKDVEDRIDAMVKAEVVFEEITLTAGTYDAPTITAKVGDVTIDNSVAVVAKVGTTTLTDDSTAITAGQVVVFTLTVDSTTVGYQYLNGTYTVEVTVGAVAHD